MVSFAIAKAANHVFGNHSQGFDIFVFGNVTAKIEKIVNEVAKSTESPVRLNYKPVRSYENPFLDRPATMFFNSWNDYWMNIYNVLEVKRYRSSNLFFLIYVDDAENRDFLDKYSELVKGVSRFFLDYFIDVGEDSITLSTFQDFYNASNCTQAHRTIVNEFSFATKTWQSEKFFMNKFDNLNQCKLEINVIYPQNLAMQVKRNGKHKPAKYDGYTTKFDKIISQKLNFTSVFNPVRMVFKETSHHGLLRCYKHNEKHCYLQYEVNSLRRLSRFEDRPFYTVTNAFSKADEIILISRFKPYTTVEKVFLPFQPEVWKWLIGSLLVLVVTTCFILTFTSKTVRSFIFGSRVQAPLLNML
jgi:hypothetical protein